MSRRRFVVQSGTIEKQAVSGFFAARTLLLSAFTWVPAFFWEWDSTSCKEPGQARRTQEKHFLERGLGHECVPHRFPRPVVTRSRRTGCRSSTAKISFLSFAPVNGIVCVAYHFGDWENISGILTPSPGKPGTKRHGTNFIGRVSRFFSSIKRRKRSSSSIIGINWVVYNVVGTAFAIFL